MQPDHGETIPAIDHATNRPVPRGLGPTVDFLTLSEDGSDGPRVMRGGVPPGATVPLHSHGLTVSAERTSA